MEILTTIVIIAILATITMGGYKQFIDKARQKVCESNLKISVTAMRFHAEKRGVFPATLGDLDSEDIYKAYAQTMKDSDWFTRFSYSVVRFTRAKNVYAAVENLKDLVKPGGLPVTADIFHCPADKTPQNASYGINEGLVGIDFAGKSWEEAIAAEIGDQPIVADCDSYSFSKPEEELSYRHYKNLGFERMAQGIGVDECIQRRSKGGSKGGCKGGSKGGYGH